MKVLLTAVFSFSLGILVSWIWSTMDREYILVRVIDHQECSNPEYALEMNTHSVLVSGAQLALSDSKMMAAQAEAFLYAVQPRQSSEEIHYRVRARYSDCDEVTSEERTVRRGWTLYETIEDGNIVHTGVEGRLHWPAARTAW